MALPGSTRLWLRWSWRDLRDRWVQVVAIAAIIAIGTGTYTGLSSQNRWRRTSYDASYAALATHDLLVTLPEGTSTPEGSLVAAVERLRDPGAVADAEERLRVPTQVDASEAAGRTVLVPGVVVGVDVTDDGPHVDRLWVRRGDPLPEVGAGEGATVLVDSHFADHYGLPDRGELLLSTGPVAYVGAGFGPEQLLVSNPQGSALAEAGWAVLHAPLADAQALAGEPGAVDELVVRLAPGSDREAVAADLLAALAVTAPDAAPTITTIDDDRSHQRLYDDIEGDQKLFNIFAGLILAGAAFAAFNLTGRIVEAQRREIGIGMALGVPPRLLAARPILVGIEVAAAGVVAGVGVGLGIGALLADLNQALVPVPVWDQSFQPGVYLRGSALGLALVVGAVVWPVRRAVRVDPIDAIRTGPRTSSAGSGLLPRLGRLRLPGSSIGQLPYRNVVRAPRRTLLTVLGIAASIAVLVAVTGMLDSFLATVGRGEDEVLGHEPERVDVRLDGFVPIGAPVVEGILTDPAVAAGEARLDVAGVLVGDDGEEVETFLQLVDLDSDLWHPTAAEGSLASDGPALVLSRKAADDLGVGVGDPVMLRHPRRVGLGYELVETSLPVGALHPNPYRFLTYLDLDHADLLALDGIVNVVTAVPAGGTTATDLQRALFGRPGIASVEGVADVAQTLRDTISEVLGFLTVVQGAVLVLALLIAFNSTAISGDERRREHATMFAFGLPVHRVLALTIAESAIVGVLATAVGIALGRGLLQWLVDVLLPTTLPDLGLVVDVTATTYAIAAVLGTVVVALAPALTWRRLRAMDVPSNLRVVE